MALRVLSSAAALAELRRRRAVRWGGGSDVAPPSMPPQPPPGDAVLTSIAWNLRLTPEILGGGAGGGAINYQAGLYDFRADFDSLVTTANGAVSALTSAQSLPGAFSQGTAANQPSHNAAGDFVRFAAASSTDAAAGDFLLLSTQMADRYRAQGASLGVVYMLFRLTSAATWLTTLFRVGVNNTNFTGRDRRAYHVGLFTGTNRIIGIRGSATSNQNAQINNHPAVNEWTALAFVLNDSRVSGVRNGASDQVSRVFVKTKPAGTFATMQTASSAVLDTTAAWTSSSPPDGTESNLLRARYNNSATVEGFGNVDIHSFGFDAEPPITNADIEAVLDTLLARVP
jgi:hypothetical protein